MTPERFAKLRATLDRRQPDLTVLAEQIHKPRNIAALVRTGDAVGMHELNMVWPWDKHRAYSGTAMGSDRWVNIVRHESAVAAIDALQSKSFKVYAAHLSDEATDYRDVDYTVPVAILMGNEKQGVSVEAAQKVDGHIVIPMMGMVESYNVSVAAAIILAEAQRQRHRAGLYDRKRLSEQEYWDTFFRWAHPKVAKFCHDNQLAYPEIDHEDGEIIEPAAWYAQVRASAAEAN
jgi:tRNA (guanosine-2'-O-)-methyltransferase